MANTSVTYTGDGATVNFTVPFPYILDTHVKVYVNTTIRLDPSDYYWSSSSQITFVAAPATDDAIQIKRVTPGDTRLVDFQNGAVLTADDLDLSANQNFYLAQEAKEAYADLFQAELIRLGTPNGILDIDPILWLDTAVDTMLADAAAAALQQGLADISTNGQGLLDHGDLFGLFGDANVGRTAFVLDETTLEVDGGGTTLGQKFTAIAAAEGVNAAAIATEQTVRANADGAFASDIALIGASNGADTAFIVTSGTVKLDSDAGLTLGAILADYSIALDVNGYVSGFKLLNDGTTASMKILADEFLIGDPANSLEVPLPIFSVVAGQIQMMANVEINGNLLVSGTVTANEILANTITASEMAANSITSTEIAALTITAAQIAALTITAAEIKANTITAAQIKAVTISAAEIVLDTITYAQIAPATITAAEIEALTITAGVIAANAITADKILAGEITADKMNVSNLAAIVADIGSITAGNITLNTSGYIKGGQTAYDTGTGFFLGYDTAAYKFSIGDGSVNSLTWDGTTLTVKGAISYPNFAVGNIELLAANTERSSATSAWLEVKEFTVDRPGTVRITLDAKGGTPSPTILTYPKYRIKEGGSVIFASPNITSGSYAAKSHDLVVDPANGSITVEVWSGEQDPAIFTHCFVKNVKIKSGNVFATAVITD